MASIVLETANDLFAQPRHIDHDIFRDPVSPSHRTARPSSVSRQRSAAGSARAQLVNTSAPSMSQSVQSSSHTSAPTSNAISHAADTIMTSSPPPARTTPRSALQPSEPSLEQTPSQISPQRIRGGNINASSLPATTRPRKIKVRDLQHIQSFATDDAGAFSEIRNRSRSRSRGAYEEGPQYEISDMKVEHIIEMVAGLLTKITSTNDQQHEHLHRQPPTVDHNAHMSAQTSSVLAFHGKNIPSITILSYLSRINKYCPTSYEVFLSLLVYFDRMTERVNAGPIQGLRDANGQADSRNRASPTSPASSSSSSSLDSDKMEDVINASTQTATPPASGSLEKAEEQNIPGTPHSRPSDAPSIPPVPSYLDNYNLSHFFVVDSFNIHRLVIAGVTCASKFFSDIFYTNSRYAKVC